jgi:hypothetical protein
MLASCEMRFEPWPRVDSALGKNNRESFPSEVDGTSAQRKLEEVNVIPERESILETDSNWYGLDGTAMVPRCQ